MELVPLPSGEAITPRVQAVSIRFMEVITKVIYRVHGGRGPLLASQAAG